MTRRRIIAGVILLAAVIVAIPFAPGVWRAVAYVQIPTSSGRAMLTLTGEQVLGSEGMVSNTVTIVVESGELTAHGKRYAWLPGDEFMIPDQVCSMCKTRNHTNCFPRHISRARFITPDGTRVDLPATFHCTCTHPSHDGDSE